MNTTTTSSKHFDQYESPDLQESNRCPNTNQRVRGADWEHFPMNGGQVSWWQCPSCNGWHVIMSGDYGNR